MTNKTASDAARSLALLYAAIYRRCQPRYFINLSHQAVRSLQFISEGPATVQGVAAHLGCAPNSASEIVRRLVQRGLVAKSRSPNDERIVELSLTQDGVRALEEQTLLDQEKLARCLERMPADEREAVRSGLDLLLNRLKEADRC